MSLNAIRENAVLLCLIIVAFAIFKEVQAAAAAVVLLALWYQHTADHTWVIVLILFALISIPRFTKDMPRMKEGKITEVKNSYVIVQNGKEKLLVYTTEKMKFDSTVSLKPEYKEIQSQKSFYSFDFSRYMAENNVYYSADEACILSVRENFSLRTYIQKQIDSNPNPIIKNLLYSVIFHIGERDEDTFIHALGFSYIGILWIFRETISLFQTEKQAEKTVFWFHLFLCIFYHFPILLFHSLIRRILRIKSKMTSRQIFSCSFIIVICIMPQCVNTLAFQISFVYQLFRNLPDTKKENILLIQSVLQSVRFSYCEPLRMLLYPVMMRISGLLWYAGMIQIIMRRIPFLGVIRFLDPLTDIAKCLRINGNCIGIGMIFYILIYLMVKKQKYAERIRLAMFLIFLHTGMFHPFPECTFINVGQGDSILLRGMLNRDNVLIDTGKPEQWNYLNNYLQAKSIDTLSIFFVTHEDSDHSGNKELVIDMYHPKQTITDHFETVSSGQMKFYDLNTIKNEDQNQSSLVLYTQISRCPVLLMGDADEYTEKSIVTRYPSLKTEILKLSHHGSKTGSCDLFLDTVRPAFAAISCGNYEMYHHPSEEVIQRLLKRHIPYFDTKSEGDITIYFLPLFQMIITASGKIAFF